MAKKERLTPADLDARLKFILGLNPVRSNLK